MKLDERLALARGCPILRPPGAFRHGHADALRDVPHRLWKRHFLLELDELDHVAAGAAAEALEEALVFIDVE